MATATILHVGDDFCQRIPVLSRAGFIVVRSEDSLESIRNAFADGDSFSAVVFHCDVVPLQPAAVHETRSLSAAPLVLFQNPTVDCVDHGFDLVIPVLTPPATWLTKLEELIQESYQLQQRAQLLRQDCESERARSHAL